MERRVWRDGYKDQIVTMLHSVTWVCLCIPGHIHSSCSTVMAGLCIPVTELVSLAFSTISICPFFIYLCISNVSWDTYRDQIVTMCVS